MAYTLTYNALRNRVEKGIDIISKYDSLSIQFVKAATELLRNKLQAPQNVLNFYNEESKLIKIAEGQNIFRIELDLVEAKLAINVEIVRRRDKLTLQIPRDVERTISLDDVQIGSKIDSMPVIRPDSSSLEQMIYFDEKVCEALNNEAKRQFPEM